MTNLLLSCPFCKGKPYVENFYDKTLFAITCLKCKATTDWYTSYEAAAAAWNTRVEHTCRNISSDYLRDEFICSECGHVDGAYEYGSRIGEHCKGCGAKVVE